MQIRKVVIQEILWEPIPQVKLTVTQQEIRKVPISTMSQTMQRR